jgi:hypothetical protein
LRIPGNQVPYFKSWSTKFYLFSKNQKKTTINKKTRISDGFVNFFLNIFFRWFLLLFMLIFCHVPKRKFWSLGFMFLNKHILKIVEFFRESRLLKKPNHFNCSLFVEIKIKIIFILFRKIKIYFWPMEHFNCEFKLVLGIRLFLGSWNIFEITCFVSATELPIYWSILNIWGS